MGSRQTKKCGAVSGPSRPVPRPGAAGSAGSAISPRDPCRADRRWVGPGTQPPVVAVPGVRAPVSIAITEWAASRRRPARRPVARAAMACVEINQWASRRWRGGRREKAPQNFHTGKTSRVRCPTRPPKPQARTSPAAVRHSEARRPRRPQISFGSPRTQSKTARSTGGLPPARRPFHSRRAHRWTAPALRGGAPPQITGTTPCTGRPCGRQAVSSNPSRHPPRSPRRRACHCSRGEARARAHLCEPFISKTGPGSRRTLTSAPSSPGRRGPARLALRRDAIRSRRPQNPARAASATRARAGSGRAAGRPRIFAPLAPPAAATLG